MSLVGSTAEMTVAQQTDLASAIEAQELDAKLACVNAARQRKVAHAMASQSFPEDVRTVCLITGPLNDLISHLSHRTSILQRLVEEHGLNPAQITELRKTSPS
jgi:hypothetical protein